MKPGRWPAARVTVVTASYHRPAVLACAIGSVLAQTFAHWRLLVIGDHCTDETRERVHAFRDPRIRYLDLAHRCGEQSGPNSVGLALAETEWVAFLNHDDLWLPDHLEHAVRSLSETRQDFHLAGSIVVQRASPADDGGFDLETRAGPDPARGLSPAFGAWPGALEPASAWVFRRELANRVGPWHPANRLHRTPLADWILRAWRAGARTAPGPMTVLKINTHNLKRSLGGTYARATGEHQFLLDQIRSTPPEDLRQELQRAASRARPGSQPGEAARNLHAFSPFARRLAGPLLSPPFAHLYRLTGLDPFNLLAALSGRRRGDHLRRSLEYRTGETLPQAPDLPALVAAARAELAAQESTANPQ